MHRQTRTDRASAALSHRVDALAEAAPAQVSGILVRALADVLQQRGVSLEALLGRAADQFVVSPFERRLSLADYQALLERSIQLTGR